jgi:hypothetical protein
MQYNPDFTPSKCWWWPDVLGVLGIPACQVGFATPSEIHLVLVLVLDEETLKQIDLVGVYIYGAIVRPLCAHVNATGRSVRVWDSFVGGQIGPKKCWTKKTLAPLLLGIDIRALLRNKKITIQIVIKMYT